MYLYALCYTLYNWILTLMSCQPTQSIFFLLISLKIYLQLSYDSLTCKKHSTFIHFYCRLNIIFFYWGFAAKKISCYCRKESSMRFCYIDWHILIQFENIRELLQTLLFVVDSRNIESLNFPTLIKYYTHRIQYVLIMVDLLMTF